VIHAEYFAQQTDALKREILLKGGQGREWIKQEIIPLMKSVGFISA
jgi:hypothetical protein